MPIVMPLYREAGTGFPVICLHASASGPGQWRALMARLVGRYRVLAPNRIGYGGNPAWRGDRPPRLADEVAALAPLLDGVGHMGPVTHPDRVNAAIERFLGRILGEERGRTAEPGGKAA